jgi:hypothetical protein
LYVLLCHIGWNIPSVVPIKPDPSLHQNLLDILNDHNIAQVIDKPTRNDRTVIHYSVFLLPIDFVGMFFFMESVVEFLK